jgi:xylulokinase
MFLGLDVGTSSLKAVVLDAAGAVLSTASSPYEVDRPRDGWSEQPPERWWAGACKAVPRAIADAKLACRDIRAVGLSGQMHGSVFLDAAALRNAKDGPIKALRPALLWNDQRTGAQCVEIESRMGGREALVRAVANPALTGFTLPKVLWLREHEPRVFAMLAEGGKIGLPKDFVSLRLTGSLTTDVGDASGTLLLNVEKRSWSEEVCRVLGLDMSILPQLVESGACIGAVTPWAASRIGLAPGTPVVAGSGDNQAGAIGAGIVVPGLVLATLGTSGVIYAHSPRARLDPAGRVLTMCAADGLANRVGHWSITGCTLSAGGALQWARDTIAPGVPFDTLMGEAAAVAPGCEGLLFLPYLSGERCPFPDPKARAGWIGLTARHTRAHMIRAVIEGVTFTMRQILDLVRNLPVEVARVRLGGGGNKSHFWRQMQADVYETPVAALNCDEGPAYGAALLAGVGVGHWPTVEAACAATIHETEVLNPNPATAKLYHHPRALHANLYPQLKSTFDAIAAQ